MSANAALPFAESLPWNLDAVFFSRSPSQGHLSEKKKSDQAMSCNAFSCKSKAGHGSAVASAFVHII